MREALDPANNTGIALPPDNRLRADLCAPTWEVQGAIIKVEGREEILKRIGRSPDSGSAYILALIDSPKRQNLPGQFGARTGALDSYDPYRSMT